MKKIDLNNKTFVLLKNSEYGKVNSETVFKYKQEGDLVTAEYHGGTIRTGRIVGRLEASKLHMLYQCLTVENELNAGTAVADVFLNEKNKLHLKLHWEWLNSSKEAGVSEYVEI